MQKREWPSRMSQSLGIGYFIHIVPLSAVALLILNDHYLKRAHSSGLTGKLSDFAGLFFFPIFLCALWNLGKNLWNYVVKKDQKSFSWISLSQAVIAILLTDFIFVSVKSWPVATGFYLQLMGAIGYPSEVTKDATDLIGLIVNPLTLWFVRTQERGSILPSLTHKLSK